MGRKLSKKELVAAKILSRHEKYIYVDKFKIMSTEERHRRRTQSIPVPPQITMSDRNIVRTIPIPIKPEIIPEIIISELYQKKNNIDFDMVICISSFNRYEKINNILKQFFSQKTNYSFKIILYNDGSTDKRYDSIELDFPDVVYLKNEINGGKVKYWQTVNEMWGIGRNFKSHTLLQLDDDFILCDNFIDILLNKFFEIKEINNRYMIFTFHLYNFEKDKPIEDFWFDEDIIFVDGGVLYDTQFMDLINFKLDKISERVTLRTSSYTWVRIKERIIELKLKIYRFKSSLVWHTGNNDSKLHPTVRHKKRVYTKNFIDEEKIKIYEQFD